MNINKLENKINTAGKSEIFCHLKKCSDSFIPRLDESVNISDYSSKIFEKATLFECWDGEVLVGLVAAYFNDYDNKFSYITNVSVLKEYFGKGIASNLLKNCIDYGSKNNFSKIILEVEKSNTSAINLYKKFNFKEIGLNENKINMSLDILRSRKKFMKIAPVLISVYNRPVHFRKCIESLKKNELAIQTHLFITIDAPFREEDIAPNKEIIEYSKDISGFKEVTLLIREKNLGILKNDTLAMKEVFSLYDRLIRTEDDNIFSENFLSFVNEGLEFYENNDKIFSVCAYNYPINTESFVSDKGFYYSNLFSGWGFGVWKKKWEKINWDKDDVLNETRIFLKKYKDVYKYNKTANNLVLNLIYMVKNDTIYGDSFISLFQYLNNCYSVFPATSMVRNIGHDNSGEHCKNKKKYNIYEKQDIYSGDGNFCFSNDIKEDGNVNNLLKKYFKRGLFKNVCTLIILFLFNIGFLYRKK